MKRRSLIAAAALLPFAARAAEAPLKIGSPAGPYGDILAYAIERAHAQGVEAKKIEFTDWITPNEALAAGDIDANLFQHVPFLNAAIKARGYKLVPIAAVTVMPMALFSHKVKSFDQVSSGATVAIANDPVNGARGLQLFQKAGLITLKPGVGDDATVEDIVSNPRRLRFLQLEAAQLPRALDDVAVAQVSLAYLVIAGGDPGTALLTDGAGDTHYALNFVVREDRKNDPRILRFIDIYRSPEVKAFITEHYGKFITPVW
ncbi:MAG: MetQ/NlpA family ABC transporter substrate-binding protein [Rhodopila sp.]|nr:MetQ/NlpA family ABC transporter substrate-binding protein [Rhodopila sp.]